MLTVSFQFVWYSLVFCFCFLEVITKETGAEGTVRGSGS